MSLDVEFAFTQLGPEQAGFFNTQLRAASEAVFGPVAQQAGIVALSVDAYGMRVTEDGPLHHAIMWSDPHRLGTLCLLSSSISPATDPTRAFVRFTRPNHREIGVEGVVLRFTRDIRDTVSCHGTGIIPCTDEERVIGLEESVGPRFIASALEKGPQLTEMATRYLGNRFLPRIVGLRGGAVGDLFDSIVSLPVRGRTPEAIPKSHRVYHMAAILRDAAVEAVDQQRRNGEHENVLYGNANSDAHEVSGAGLQTSQGIFIIRELPGSPHTFAVVILKHPGREDEATIEQYLIQERGAALSTVIIPASDYGMRIASESLTAFISGRHSKEDDPDPLAAGGMELLFGSIQRTVAELTSQPTTH